MIASRAPAPPSTRAPARSLVPTSLARSLVPALGAAALAGGCTSDRDLPDGFLVGAAVAGFQIEMGCPTLAPEACEDRNSDWYQFVTSTVTIAKDGNFLSGQAPTVGPGYYELWREDLARLSELGLDGYRFSIEWSRIFPRSTVGVEGHEALKALADPAALAWYREQLDELRARGITPLVTLNHYTLPVWMHDAVGCNQNLSTCSPRGWLEPNMVEEISKYAGFVARELGDRVDLWATLNEPLAVVLPGYLFPTADRSNPPAAGLRFAEARTVVVQMIRAHAKMVDAVRAGDTVDVDGDGHATRLGLVYPVTPVLPKNPDSPLDRLGAKNIFYLLNTAFLDGVLVGRLDEDLDGTGEILPELAGRSDYLGMNYYTRARVQGEPESAAPAFSELLTINPLGVEQGDVYPQGLEEMLVHVKQTYGDIPIYISENGTHPGLQDQERFFVEHFQHILRAIHEHEVDVRGYFWWSLMDNYEWNHGMDLRFGLYEVKDDAMKTRVKRPVADAISSVARNRGLSAELADRFPIAAP
jgi:beta-glucosidase/6-phospho-beta-glucosidase/beta-galactosidase